MAERVIVITTSFPEAPGDASGHFVRSDARRRAAHGEVHVVCPGAPRLRRDGEITVHGVGGEALFAWPGAWARARERPTRLAHAPAFALRARSVVRELARGGPSRVVAHWALPSAWPIAAAHAGPLEIVSHGADVRLLLRLPRPARAELVRRLLGAQTTWTFVSQALRAELLAGLDASLGARLAAQSRVEPAPLELPEREALPALAPRFRLEPGRYVVWVGRDVPSKRLELALTACARARVRLAVVGAARAADSEHVRWLGALPRPEALSVIAHAGALLSTSAVEGAPTVVREARALGVDVVACDAGDLRSWAERDRGISLVAPEVAQIASALVRRGLSGT